MEWRCPRGIVFLLTTLQTGWKMDSISLILGVAKRSSLGRTTENERQRVKGRTRGQKRDETDLELGRTWTPGIRVSNHFESCRKMIFLLIYSHNHIAIVYESDHEDSRQVDHLI